jgi:hypothetical protein
MATSVGPGKVLDRAHEDKTLQEILDSPPSALAGLTEPHNQVLSEVFGIQTVAELGSNSYFALAGALVALANKLKSGTVSVLSTRTVCLTLHTMPIHDQSASHNFHRRKALANNCFARRLIGNAMANRCSGRY